MRSFIEDGSTICVRAAQSDRRTTQASRGLPRQTNDQPHRPLRPVGVRARQRAAGEPGWSGGKWAMTHG